MQPSQLAKYQAYALANQTAPKTRQVVMLYDGAIRNLRQAREAIDGKRVEERYNLLVKASDIVVGLQSCLDFDNGGEISKILYDFYSSIDARIISIHRTQSPEMCEVLIGELKQMRDAWNVIDQQPENASGATPAAAPLADDAAVVVADGSKPVPAPDVVLQTEESQKEQPASASPLSGVEISA